MSKTCESCSPIMSRPYTPEGEETWDRVFGKKEVRWVVPAKKISLQEFREMYQQDVEEEDGRRESDK